jgi:hypothetical protein
MPTLWSFSQAPNTKLYHAGCLCPGQTNTDTSAAVGPANNPGLRCQVVHTKALRDKGDRTLRRREGPCHQVVITRPDDLHLDKVPAAIGRRVALGEVHGSVDIGCLGGQPGPEDQLVVR